MSKKKTTDYIGTWSTKHPRTGNRKYWAHREYGNGDVGASESWSSRSGRSARIRRMKEREPGLQSGPAKQKPKKK